MRFLPLMLGRRFLFFLREEGWRATLARTRLWCRMRWKGHRGSILPDTSHGARQAGSTTDFWVETARNGSFTIAAPPAASQRRKVALIGDLNLPQCRKYRVEQVGELLAQIGVDFIFAHYEDRPRCMDILQDATHVMLYRLRSHPAVTEHLYEARRLKLPVLYDIDDPLFSVPAYAGYRNMAGLPRDMQRDFIAAAPSYAEVMNLADVISVSTPGLQEHARDFTTRPVFLRRNFADRATLGQTRPPGSRKAAGFHVCFASGSRGHEEDFAEIAEDVATFLAGKPERQLVILGHFDRARLPAALQPRIRVHPFCTYAEYLRHLADCDVSVMPLADDLFNRCKSAVRVIDAAAMEVPSIVGQVSDMTAMVRDGETGRVLPPGASWAEALERMATDPAATRQMGRKARADLETRWQARPDAPVADPDLIRWIRS